MPYGDKCALESCQKKILVDGQTLYCSPRHKKTAERQRSRVVQKEKRAIARAIEETGTADALVAENIALPLYQRYRELGLHDKLLNKTVDYRAAADLLKCSVATIYRMREYGIQEKALAQRVAVWEPEPWAADLLLDENFAEFREQFFEVRAGVPYITTGFHHRWINLFNKTLQKGGRGLVLSPPRHGKTDTLQHKCVQLILRDPDIHIMWISKNERVARRVVKAVKQILADHVLLRKTYLPPGQFWKPERRSGLTWASNEFQVANQSVIGQKSPTFQAIGRGGSIINQDVDILICDDIEDSNATNSETERQKTREWWVTDIGSRIMKHTAIFYIGSRIHADDLAGRHLSSPIWEKIVEHAHDPECPLPELPLAAHVDCMLWPEMNDYEWLVDLRIEADSKGGRKLWSMVYQNDVEQWSTVIFQRSHMEQCRNWSRSLGQYPKGLRLVGGLDPAITGFQAAFLWGFDVANRKQYMIDVDNEQGGGRSKFISQMAAWKEKYGLTLWVLEENGWQKGYALERDVTVWRDRNNVRIVGHETYGNKWDPRFGLKGLANMFEDEMIDLPYGDVNSQAATDLYIQQAVMTEPGVRGATGANSRGVRSDLVLASWFPQKEWRRLMRKLKQDLNDAKNRHEAVYENYDPYDDEVMV